MKFFRFVSFRKLLNLVFSDKPMIENAYMFEFNKFQRTWYKYQVPKHLNNSDLVFLCGSIRSFPNLF